MNMENDKLMAASFPFEDPVVVIKLKGQQLLEALQNGVSKYPALDGRFPQVSNISFTFDPSRNAQDRVVGVQIGGLPLDLNREYTLATRDFLVRGGGTCWTIVDDTSRDANFTQMAIIAFVHNNKEGQLSLWLTRRMAY
jgi:2',3'-cyclic-nucleotide 2'-phosphodiesterase (5'-nucleotidase family)